MRKKDTQQLEFAQHYHEVIGLSKIIQQMLILGTITSVAIFIVWSRNGIGITARMMGILFAVNVFLIFVHRSGRAMEAGLGLFATVAIIITTLSSFTDGIYSLPNIFYPILLVFSGILFGRRMIPHVTVFLIILISLLFGLDRVDLIVPFQGRVTWAPDFFALMVIIMIVTALILSLTLKTIEENLLQIATSERIIKESYELTLEGWAKALELSGREPEGHARRVTELIMAFAEDMGLNGETRSRLRHGALLHDIGKIGVSDSILKKNGPLSNEEIQLCQEHTLFARKMLSDITYLESLTDIPVYHHEQWDGKGYPEGLQAEQIPYLARIFALIDNWVSLTSQQAYRPAWSEKEAFSYIQEQAGKKFDQKITDDFLAFLNRQQGGSNEGK